MEFPYADSNFVVALYLETGFAEAAEASVAKARAEGPLRLPMTELLLTEVANAMQLHVFASRNGGPLRITWEMAAAAFGQFEEDVSLGRIFAKPDLSVAQVTKAAVELSLRHTAKHGFRTYDVLHVASALLLKCDHFWSFDVQARKLAALEGLALNPWPAP